MTGELASELHKVRAASYGAACCLAVLVVFAASLPVRSRVAVEFVADARAVIVTEAPRALETPEVQPDAAPDRIARLRATRLADQALSPRLWTYSPTGAIVFDWREQYERCVRARSRGASEADCPNPAETRELVLGSDAPARFDLGGIPLAARD